ncbi:flagellar filament capping protein FliD [Kurthia massiliensis]|uniref:flagellar filament capping protein FliD n=1 Tax=Kurthia massiliensis TaxID=1033739 RepID=UPI000287D16A|nr:flagellar filament capping protein FliD [Kurthia massiliensis]
MVTTNNTNSASSTPSFSYLQYKNKIGGLVSGMDIDSIMEKLMKAENAQKEKLQQQKQKYEWQRDAYREVNTKLKTFEENALTSYGLQSSWNAKTVTTSNSAVSATATASANGNLSIEKASLATAGKTIASLSNVVSSSGKVSDLGVTSTNGKFSFSVDGGDTQTIEYSKDDTLDSLITKLNNTGVFEASIAEGKITVKTKEGRNVNVNDTDGPYSSEFAKKLGFTVDASSNSLSTSGSKTILTQQGVTADTTLAQMGLKDGSFKIKAISENGEYVTKEISYKATDKLSNVMNKINASGVGITAIVSGDKLSLTVNTEGAGKDNLGAMNVEEDVNGLFKKLGLLSGQTGDLTAGTATAIASKGEDGSITVNGVEIKGTSNKYSISGYNLTINKSFDSTASTNPDEVTKISATTDTDKIVDKVKEFVKSYNELIADITARTSEKKNTSYSPLTDAQKSEMTTDQITKWEDLAKKGLLKGDSTLNTVVSNMRQTLAEYNTYTLSADGKDKIYTKNPTDVLYKIGITTSSTWSDGGKLEIDEDKLKKALTDDPDIVSRIFAGDSSNGKDGIIASLRKTAQNAVTTIKDKAGSETSSADNTYSLGKTISSLKTKIDDWTDRLKDIEERYWNQFSAMEKAIQKANSQTSIFDSY